jgi:hypothetical protein
MNFSERFSKKRDQFVNKWSVIETREEQEIGGAQQTSF